MFNRFPMLSRIGLFIVTPLLLAALLGYRYLTLSLPAATQQLSFAQLAQPVDISFDAQGTALVVAKTDRDAFFAQGYLHASQRMWQMQLQRQLVQGRLAELFGKSAVGMDVWMRTLNLRPAAQQALDGLSIEAKTALEAYAEGVNAWLDTTQALPIEFKAFDVQPKPWQAVDSIAWQKVFALNFSKNMYDELNREKALQRLTVAQLKMFYPFDDLTQQNALAHHLISAQSDKTEDDYRFSDFAELQQQLRQHWALGERFAGSNAWVVAGKHTQSGLPLLAGDPHTSVEQPSHWYAMHMKGDRLAATGMSMIGLPGIMLGRNDNIAWAATSLMADQQDLFVLDIPRGNPEFYHTDTGLKPIDTRLERIDIRGDFPTWLNEKILPLEFEVRTTALGPIVSDAVVNSDKTLALRWSGLDKVDNSFETFYRLQYASNWSQFRRAVSHLKAPGFRLLYADVNGNIGAQVGGMMPVRGSGTGILPQLASHNANLWQGLVPFEQLPSEYNPESGYIVSANNHIDSLDHVVLSHEWASDARKDRIEDLLQQQMAASKLTIGDMQRMQLDQLDVGAVELLTLLNLPGLTAPLATDELSQAALNALLAWDGSYSIDSSAASIFHYWLDEMKRAILADELNPAWSLAKGGGLSQDMLSLVDASRLAQFLSDDANLWCNSSSSDVTPCQALVVDSFHRAIDALESHTRSDDLDDWQWGNLHFVEFNHKPFGQLKFLGKVFSNKVAVGGSTNTVNVSNAVKNEHGELIETFGASFRQVFDLKGEGAFALSTGQSGHFLSPHYDDQTQAFIDGQYSQLQWPLTSNPTPNITMTPKGE